MRKMSCGSIKVMCAVLLLFFLSMNVSASEVSRIINAPITEAKLFKNGIAMVTRSFKLNGVNGEYVIADGPVPIYGTFWVESDADVRFCFTEEKLKRTFTAIDRKTLIDQLSGENVELFLQNNQTVKGTIIGLNDDKSEKTENELLSDSRDAGQLPGFISILTDDGLEVIDFNSIWRLKFKNRQKRFSSNITKPVMKVFVERSGSDSVIRFSYLTRGLTWMPDYSLTMRKGKSELALKTVIKNELMNINDADFYLISGFPSIKFENVVSPVAPNTTIKRFLEELASGSYTSRHGGSPVIQQQIISNIPAQDPPQEIISQKTMFDGSDLYFQHAGRLSIKKGDAYQFKIASGNIETKQIVECRIEEKNGFSDHYQQHLKSETECMDVLIFRNPFPFPMTTAPVSIYNDRRFIGETISHWTAPEEKARIETTKALNIRVKNIDKEVPGSRNQVKIAGEEYYKTMIEGNIDIINLRSKNQDITISRVFSGKFISGDRNPQITLLGEGAFEINEKNKAVWNITIEPNKRILIKYRYSVLNKL